MMHLYFTIGLPPCLDSLEIEMFVIYFDTRKNPYGEDTIMAFAHRLSSIKNLSLTFNGWGFDEEARGNSVTVIENVNKMTKLFKLIKAFKDDRDMYFEAHFSFEYCIESSKEIATIEVCANDNTIMFDFLACCTLDPSRLPDTRMKTTGSEIIDSLKLLIIQD
jgi:hypothetical protein